MESRPFGSMDWLFTLSNMISLALAVCALWVGYSRYAGRLDGNAPVLYYIGLLGYLQYCEGVLDPYAVYGGLITALLLRFEFMGGPMMKLVRSIESVFLLYVVWRAGGVVIYWW